MNADWIHALLALACLFSAAAALIHLAQGTASYVTAMDLAFAAAVWSVLVDAPIWAPILGVGLALTFGLISLVDEDAEIEAMQS